jgi:hypothetical protein
MSVDSAAEESTAGAADDEAAKAAADKLAADKLAEEEAAKAAADKLAEEEAAKAAEEASKAREESAKVPAEEAGEGSGGRTDGTEAAGAPGATPAAEPSAAASASTSDDPSPKKYLKAGDGVYVNLPWAVGSREPAEGEAFDEEILVAAGLKLVDAPSISDKTSKEERLLQKLMSLYRAR